MSSFHYGAKQLKFKDQYELLYSDTDSLLYNNKHHNLHDWMNNKSNDFDRSSMRKFKTVDKYHILGKFKSEVNYTIITEFCDLNPKRYTYNSLENGKLKSG